MILRRLFIVIFIGFVSMPVLATGYQVWTEEVSVDLNSNSANFYVTYQEGRLFLVDIYFQQGSNFQRRIGQKIFLHKKDLNNFISNNKLIERAPTIFHDDYLPISELSGEYIWETKESWSMTWERAYADWISANVDEDFFKRYNIAVDCADVAISLRWIFSRIYGLPMASTLSGSGRIFTNESMLKSWRVLPISADWYNDERFLKALAYINETTFTHSLKLDSYPVAINKDVFTPGVHHLNLYEETTGHTMVVSEVNTVFGGVFLLYSSTPKKVRSLWKDYFSNARAYKSVEDGGFLKIRWAVKESGRWSLVEGSSMPGYSLEQYDKKFSKGHSSYADAIEARLGAAASIEEKMRQGIRMIDDRLQLRRSVVEEGFALCQISNCSPGTLNYEFWSTPSRDKQIRDLYEYLNLKAKKSFRAGSLWSDYKNKVGLDIEGKWVKMKSLLLNFQKKKCSYDPRAKISKRWGLK